MQCTKLFILKTFNIKMLRIIEVLSSKILALYMPNAFKIWESEVAAFWAEIRRLVDTRGIRFTVAYVKTSRNAVMRVVSGRPLQECDGVRLVDGWPSWLSGFELAKYSTQGMRLLLTLLTGLRGVILPPVLDLEPITKP